MNSKQRSLFAEDESGFDAKTFFERLAEQLLRSYIDRVRLRQRVAPKELNDPVWQTLTVFPLEVLILDSPLLQRLRGIRQLGVAHYVYPGTTHTRLEHSLGVMTQVQRLADAINASGKGPVIDHKTVRLLRLIALCHDIGHGVMSHVCENALRRYEEVESIELAFADKTDSEKAKLSEIAAYYLTGSPAWRCPARC